MKKEGYIVMGLNSIVYFFKEAFKSLVRNKWMSIASIGAVAAALIILGSFSLLSVNFDHILKDVESQVEVTAYLKDSVDSEEISKIDREMSNISGVKEVEFVSKNDAWKSFKKQMGEELLEGMDNPLPNSFKIRVDNPKNVATVAGEIQKFPEMDKVKYGKGVVDKLFNTIYWIRWIGIVVMVVFAAISIFIISNTIRLTVFARSREIKIMKYIGATDWFVRWPFLIEGMVLGLLGSAIAVGILAAGYDYIYFQVKLNLPMISLIPIKKFYNHGLGALLVGMLIGTLGSGFSLKRFLRV